MRRVCAWCNKDLGVVASHHDETYPITHGVCHECKMALTFQSGETLHNYLDGLNAPVVLVDFEGRIKTANLSARSALGKDLSAIEDVDGGTVFECAYARLPEGCGNTVHCSGCTIRRSVMATLATGKSLLNVPATLNVKDPVNPEKVSLHISTEKAGKLVLLRIDDMGP